MLLLNIYAATAAADAPPDDPVKIVAGNGANIARLRIWNDPPYLNQTYANVSNVIKLAKRVHAAGVALAHVTEDLQYVCVCSNDLIGRRQHAGDGHWPRSRTHEIY